MSANFRVGTVALVPGSRTVLTNMPPGDYQLQLSQAVSQENAKAVFIKSIRLGRQDAFETVHLSSDNRETLEVVLTTETGAVEGVALDRTGDPAANVTVVLVPRNARKRTDLYQSLLTGSDGKFRFQEIPAGDYKLFAWEDIETGAWGDSEFMRSYEARGREIRISENGKEAVQLSVIYNP
jgi:hypothetical protein